MLGLFFLMSEMKVSIESASNPVHLFLPDRLIVLQMLPENCSPTTSVLCAHSQSLLLRSSLPCYLNPFTPSQEQKSSNQNFIKKCLLDLDPV